MTNHTSNSKDDRYSNRPVRYGQNGCHVVVDSQVKKQSGSVLAVVLLAVVIMLAVVIIVAVIL